MDKVVHFEIPVEDMKRAEEFYSSVFNWEMHSVPEMKYIIIHTVKTDEKGMPNECGAINGGMMKRNESVKSPVITINVENINESLDKIKKSGGRIVLEPFKVGEIGMAAYFEDPERNVLGLWQNL